MLQINFNIIKKLIHQFLKKKKRSKMTFKDTKLILYQKKEKEFKVTTKTDNVNIKLIRYTF